MANPVRDEAMKYAVDIAVSAVASQNGGSIAYAEKVAQFVEVVAKKIDDLLKGNY